MAYTFYMATWPLEQKAHYIKVFNHVANWPAYICRPLPPTLLARKQRSV